MKGDEKLSAFMAALIFFIGMPSFLLTMAIKPELWVRYSYWRYLPDKVQRFMRTQFRVFAIVFLILWFCAAVVFAVGLLIKAAE